eukprot:179756_1
MVIKEDVETRSQGGHYVTEGERNSGDHDLSQDLCACMVLVIFQRIRMHDASDDTNEDWFGDKKENKGLSWTCTAAVPMGNYERLSCLIIVIKISWISSVRLPQFLKKKKER